MTDFAELLARSLPGIYRLKDGGDLARFLQIMASPLAETEASIGQLYDDLFGATARGALLPLVGALVGAEVDPALPASLGRAALEDTLAFYRNKGLAAPLARAVEASTGWRTVAVDYSQVVARALHIESRSALQRQRRRPIGVDSGGANRFHFDAAARGTRLFDEQRGRAIARAEIATLAAELVGTDRGFAIRENGVDLVGPRAAAPRPVIGADLTDFAAPRALDGTPLVLTAGQIAVDPELGRLRFAAPVPLAGNLLVDFHQVVSASIERQTFDLRDPRRMAQLGRSDDPAPYTVDLRTQTGPSDRIGRTHFDNHGLFLTVGRTFDNRRPNPLAEGPPAGFSFDDTALAAGDTVGNPLQLQDGIDGSPITVAELADHAAELVDTPRGFTITARGQSLLDPSFNGGARVVAARLADLANPRDASGAALTLQPRDIAVDPQLGRFLLDLASLGVTAAELRVGYLMAPVTRIVGATPAPIGPADASTFAFAADGRVAPLRNGFDGTPIAVALRLGGVIGDYHGKPRGYRILVGSLDLTNAGTLTPQLVAIDGPTTAPAGQMLVDLERGRFALPPGTVPAGVAVTVELSAADGDAEARVFASLRQRLPRLVPAGVEPIVVDTRKPVANLSNFALPAKA